MKTYKPILLATMLLLTAPVWAQQGNSTSGVTIRREPAGATSRTQLPAKVEVPARVREKLTSKRINLELNSASADEALKQLLDASGCGYDYDPSFYPDPQVVAKLNTAYGGATASPGIMDLPARFLTMKMVNASLPNALDSVCKALGVGWTTTEDSGSDSPTIHIVRLSGTVTRTDLLSQPNIAASYAGGIGGGGFGGGGAGSGRDERIRLLDNALTRVSVDLKDKPVRGALIEVLKAANIEYVLEEDVAQAKNVTVFLKDVSLRTALDALCESAGIGWMSDNDRQSQDPTARLVRVGKRYAPSTL